MIKKVLFIVLFAVRIASAQVVALTQPL